MFNKTLFINIVLELVMIIGVAMVVVGIIFMFYPDLTTAGKNDKAAIALSYSPEEYKLDNIRTDLDSFQHEKQINVDIKKGISGLEVANILSQKGLIPKDEFLKLMVLFNFEKRIKAGKYKFSSDDNVTDILSTILVDRIR